MCTLGWALICSVRKLPSVWSSFLKMKSDVFDMPTSLVRGRYQLEKPSLMLTRIHLLLNLLLAIGEQEELKAVAFVSIHRIKSWTGNTTCHPEDWCAWGCSSSWVCTRNRDWCLWLWRLNNDVRGDIWCDRWCKEDSRKNHRSEVNRQVK